MPKMHFNKRILALAMVLFMSFNFSVLADPPTCDCDDFTPGTPDYLACEAALDDCTGSDVPVTDNLWIVVSLGTLVAIVSLSGKKEYFTLRNWKNWGKTSS